MKYLSLATKNAIVYFLLAMTGLATLGYLLFKNSAAEIIHSSEQQVKHAGDLVALKFNAFLQDVRRDITYLVQSPYLRDYLNSINSAQADAKKELLANEYLALLNSKPDYSQIRLIQAANNGKEIIRAERNSMATFLVPADSLQEKGQRNYFLETILLPEDSIYFSAIDLNKEFGQITAPPVPTLRTASPVYAGNKLYGILVINVDLRGLFDEINILAGPNYHLKLFNQEGHFLIHPDQQKTFTFEYGRLPEFQNDFGISIREMTEKYLLNKNKIIKHQQNLYALRIIDYPRKGYRLFAGIGSGEKEILQSFFLWRKKSMSITFGLSVLIFILAFIYMRRQSKELKDITETMTSFPQTIVPAKLPITRNDEIGQLAKSFEEMSAIISDNLLELKKAKEIVEQAVKDKDAFLENMSHEIRNPIHSIIGMTHLLEKNNPSRHQQAFIESLKFNSKNLLSLVNDVLDFRKMSAGEILIQPEWFFLPGLITEISKSQQFNAVSKKIKLTVETPPELNQCLIYSDPNRLTQIINNLAINAIKFTDEKGTVKIAATILEKAEDAIKIRLSVQDDGIGIAEDDVHKIVERHYTKTKFGPVGMLKGAGLGLPIVVHLLELFSSELQIESAVGKGSNFYFDLQTPSRQQNITAQKDSGNIFKKILSDVELLVLDDDEQILFLYESIFKNRTKRLVKVSDTEEIHTIKRASFDVVITDVYFKENNLNKFKTAIKNLIRENGFIYVVSGSEKNIDHFVEVKRQFQKPIDPSEILEHLTEDIAIKKYGAPNTQSIFLDYDQDAFKFEKAIRLLIDEWIKMYHQIESAIANHDKNKFEAIRHKLITSVRRLQLDHFEKILNQPFPKKEHTKAVYLFSEKVKTMMGFYIWFLKKRS